MSELPIYKIHGKYYYRDERLNEYRNVNDVNDTLDINISNEELETPTKNDNESFWKKHFTKKNN